MRGLALVTAGGFAIVWALMRSGAAGWGSAEVLATLIAGSALVAAFIVWERRAPAPMLPPAAVGQPDVRRGERPITTICKQSQEQKMTKMPITPKLTAGEARAVAAASDGDATSQHDPLPGERERHAASEKPVGTNLLGAHDDLGRGRAALEPELIETRRTLHRHPELAFAEHRTAKLVADRLRAIGYEPRVGVGGTGIIADLDGGRPGPTLLIRADMDALPLDELPGRSYGSQTPGRMHACGHDAHTSALLGVAALLARRREQLAGRVRLLFQPAEETGQGAQAVIHDGALDGVDEALMAHVSSPLPFGTVALREGVALMGVDFFELTVDGGGGHAGLAHQARDAVLAAAQLITALQTITARETSPLDSLGLTIASIAGGTAANVVADQVTLRGTLRWLDTALRERALARIEQISRGICSALRVSHQLEVTATVPVLQCAADPIARLTAAAAATHVTAIDPGVLPVSDDFAHIAQRIPAAAILIGAGGPGCGAHHAPDYDIDERAIGLTTEILTRATLTH